MTYALTGGNWEARANEYWHNWHRSAHIAGQEQIRAETAEAERHKLAKALDYLLLAVTHEFEGTQRKDAITEAQAVMRDVCGVGPGLDMELVIGEAPGA